MTCWRRLRDAGLDQREGSGEVHKVLLTEPRAADRLDMSWAEIDTFHVPALGGGPKLVGARSTEAEWAPILRKQRLVLVWIGAQRTAP